jgi:transcription elongation GreA/GreB family factor
MSVAFRRESDEEHKEPKFELPIAPGPNLVTARGLVQIAERVDDLKRRIAAEGDEAVREALKRDLRYWHTRLATAEIASPPGPGQAGIGSRVRFRLAGKTREITIVGGDEADPAASRIAFSAPLARALIGTTAGDWADFNGTTDAIEIVEVDNRTEEEAAS